MATSPKTVVQRGTDTSGRALKLSQRMWDVIDDIRDELDFEFTIVKAGFLPGDDLSSTTHMGDAIDIRLYDKTSAQRAQLIRAFNARGVAYWERYPSQGFDLHGHGVPGPWASPSPSALAQYESLLDGRNGLKGNGPDYHDRSNFVKTPPNQEDKPEMNTAENKLLTQAAADAKAARAAAERTEASVLAGRRASNARLDTIRRNVTKTAVTMAAQGKDLKEIEAATAKLVEDAAKDDA